MEKNYAMNTLKMSGRDTLNEKIFLTGAEVSYNELSAGTGVPFVHTHKENEEIYIVLEGSGLLFIDTEEVPLKKGDAIRIDPLGKRQFLASQDEALKYLCIQVKQNSLNQHTNNDGVLVN